MKDLSFNTVRGHKDIYNEVMRNAPVQVQMSLTFETMLSKLKFQRQKRYNQPMESVEDIIKLLESNAIDGISKHYEGHVTMERINSQGSI